MFRINFESFCLIGQRALVGFCLALLLADDSKKGKFFRDEKDKFGDLLGCFAGGLFGVGWK